eukprot:SAG25_NODE_1379_length_3164_cov_2.328222_2_plen_213_part_00
MCVCERTSAVCVGAGRWVARRVPGGVGAVRLAALGDTTQAVAVAAAPAATAEKEEDHEKEQQTEEEQQQEEEEQEEDICPPLPPRRFKGAGFRQVLLGVESVLYVARAQAAFSPGAAPPPPAAARAARAGRRTGRRRRTCRSRWETRSRCRSLRSGRGPAPPRGATARGGRLRWYEQPQAFASPPSSLGRALGLTGFCSRDGGVRATSTEDD